MPVSDICRDVRLFLYGLAGELPDIFRQPRRQRSPGPARRLSSAQRAAREDAKEVIRARVNYWAQELQLEYNRIFVKDQRTLWASCSGKKNPNFNWRLAAAPQATLDYIIIHELCHLREMNHSKKFWDLVRLACPDYASRRKWLRENYSELRNPAPAEPT